MSTRLTNWDRDGIVTAAVHHAFEPRRAALAVAEDKLAKEAYAFLVPEAVRKQAAKLPAGWISYSATIRLNVGGLDMSLDLKKEVPLPVRLRTYGERLGAIPIGDLADRIQAHALAKEALKEERKEAQAKVKALVYSVTTVTKLREIWPEGEKFYGGIEKAEPKSFPAIRIAEVNAALGIAA